MRCADICALILCTSGHQDALSRLYLERADHYADQLWWRILHCRARHLRHDAVHPFTSPHDLHGPGEPHAARPHAQALSFRSVVTLHYLELPDLGLGMLPFLPVLLPLHHSLPPSLPLPPSLLRSSLLLASPHPLPCQFPRLCCLPCHFPHLTVVMINLVTCCASGIQYGSCAAGQWTGWTPDVASSLSHHDTRGSHFRY